MDRDEIASILENIASLLELKGENLFKVRAYRNAARTLLSLEEDLPTAIEDGTLAESPGIGESLYKKISTLVKKGRLPYYEKLKRSIHPGLLEMMHVSGIGPRKVQVLYKKLHVKSIAELKKAAEEGKIAKLKNFGEKSQKNILEALAQMETNQRRHLWWDAMMLAKPILEKLKKIPEVQRAEIAGSLRRKLETIGDLDFLVGSDHPASVVRWFINQPFVKKVLAQGESKCSILSQKGMQMDLRIVPTHQFAFALCYFTGSKEHNVHLREWAIKQGWSLSEYGLQMVKPGAKNPFAKKKIVQSEEEIHEAFGMAYIPPELRENMGEIEAAFAKKIPHLIELSDIRGSFHNHTIATDGRSPLKDMVRSAEELGWEYIGISDHSQSDFQANGLHEEELLDQIQTIRRLNKSKTFKPYIFAGLECNVLTNGSLDFSNDLLKKLDYVIVSIHSSLHQDEKTMTRRLIRAIEHPSATIVGHVTGRVLLERAPYSVDLKKVIDACIANHKIIEINGNPKRMDMDWRFWHTASQRGLLCCINADAHAADQLVFVESGVNVARKGWLTKDQVINTLSLKEITQFLKKMHPGRSLQD